MKHPFFLSLGERIHKLPDSEWRWGMDGSSWSWGAEPLGFRVLVCTISKAETASCTCGRLYVLGRNFVFILESFPFYENSHIVHIVAISKKSLHQFLRTKHPCNFQTVQSQWESSLVASLYCLWHSRSLPGIIELAGGLWIWEILC